MGHKPTQSRRIENTNSYKEYMTHISTHSKRNDVTHRKFHLLEIGST